MSAGKNPYHRYQILDSCLTNKQKRYWTKAEFISQLAEYDFTVSERTVNIDLENMRHDDRLGFHAPIAYCRKEKAYHYTDPEYSINALQLSDEQLRAFSVVVNLLQQYKGSRVVKDFEGAIEKIARMADRANRHDLDTGDGIVEFEKAPYYKGMTWLDMFVEAINIKQPLRIAYQKFTASKAEDHVFHPYLLKEYRGRWYVLGYSQKRHFTITLALDRMESIVPEPVEYKINRRLNASEYFKHTIGVTQGKGRVEDIILWFTPSQGHYIKTQHLHASQEIIQDDGTGLIISLKLIVNYELLSLLLSYCPDIRVVQPLSLRDKLDELMRKGIEVNGGK